MTRGLLGLPWVVWAGLAFAVAAVFVVVAPRAAGTSGLHHLVLRWFHPLTWVLLGTSALVRGFSGGAAPPAADLVAQVALVVYLAYLVTFIRTAPRARRPRGVT
jgi:hypothetical protein